MKTKNIDLEVDYISGQGSLTESEEKALSEYFQNKKLLHSKKIIRTTLTTKKKQNA